MPVEFVVRLDVYLALRAEISLIETTGTRGDRSGKWPHVGPTADNQYGPAARAI
jgi:hypothetical protein